MRRRLSWLVALAAVAGVPCAAFGALWIASHFVALPQALVVRTRDPSVRVLDRSGRLIREVRARDGAFTTPVRLDDVSPQLIDALVAAEDARFWHHHGIDPLAIGRATLQAMWRRRIVSGASTLTQQLARHLIDRPKTLRGKLREMATSLSIERSLDKRRILEEYVNRVEFGANLRGVETASRHYFAKPASRLSLGEAAALAALVRGPTLYDPRKGPAAAARLRARRDWVLGRMGALGMVSAAAVERAMASSVSLFPVDPEGGAEHAVRAIVTGRLDASVVPREAAVVETTLDADLEREVETLVRRSVADLARVDATAAAVLVVDNASGDILAYVGSPDFYSESALGQNDGVLALRQPGSTLKPFVYATAMQHLGYTLATTLPDVELHLSTELGDYAPHNYDGRFHGPVRLREALASSLNVPAVVTAYRAGPARVLETLERFGFESLRRAPEHYGAAIALGDGEVRLTELVAAYATLARGGLGLPIRAVKSLRRVDGTTSTPRLAAPVRVVEPAIAALLGDALSDPRARAMSFGRGNVLELPFPVAVKTGTSKGYRDNWTVGFTREVTVGVWVGNFDGHPMRGSSGVTGAAPLFRDVMLAAMRNVTPAALVSHDGLVEVEVCALSGELAGADCPHRTREWFRQAERPTARCSMHVRARIDPDNGLLAGSACRAAASRAFERYPAEYAVWAAGAGRPIVPVESSPRCPVPARSPPAADQPAPIRESAEAPRITFPADGGRFSIDPGLDLGQQELVFEARVWGSADRLDWIVDGRSLGRVGTPFSLRWRLERGAHTLFARSKGGAPSDPVHFVVE